jgi:hypothetical protein
MKNLITAFLALVCAAALPAQQPKVTDTQFKSEPVEQSLSATVDRIRHSSDQLWLGYEVPALPGTHLTACSDWSDATQSDNDCCGEYRLEDERGVHSSSKGPASPNVYILLRFDKGELVKIRPIAAGCHLNAGGISFDWVTGVKPEESIAFLAGLTTQTPEHKNVIEGALGQSAFTPRRRPRTRSNTSPLHRSRNTPASRPHSGSAFSAGTTVLWRSNRSRTRARTTRNSVRNLHSISLRTPIPPPRTNCFTWPSSTLRPGVRGQALFWVAQKAGKRATAALKDAIQNDPETEVKKKAVFALSQLPKMKAFRSSFAWPTQTQISRFAKRHSSGSVNRRIPRALAYIEQVLKK